MQISLRTLPGSAWVKYVKKQNVGWHDHVAISYSKTVRVPVQVCVRARLTSSFGSLFSPFRLFSVATVLCLCNINEKRGVAESEHMISTGVHTVLCGIQVVMARAGCVRCRAPVRAHSELTAHASSNKQGVTINLPLLALWKRI